MLSYKETFTDTDELADNKNKSQGSSQTGDRGLRQGGL